MAKKNDEVKVEEPSLLEKIGPWAFLAGLVIAVIASFTKNVAWYLGAIGLVVGLLNISDREVQKYLLASMTFLISVNALSVTMTKMAEVVPVIGGYLGFINPLLANISLFIAPGAAVVALKSLYMISKD
ncbi:MAG: hypothetical protein V1859_05220 [archaeon]